MVEKPQLAFIAATPVILQQLRFTAGDLEIDFDKQ